MKQLDYSSDSSDDVPIKYIAKSSISPVKQTITLSELKKLSSQACEFCDKTFKNMYNYLIHNSKHIIIPLLKSRPEQCTMCKQYVLSATELSDHMAVKHKIGKTRPKGNETKTELENNGRVVRKISDRIKFENDNHIDDNEVIEIDDDDHISMEPVANSSLKKESSTQMEDLNMSDTARGHEDQKGVKEKANGCKQRDILKDIHIGRKVDTIKLKPELLHPKNQGDAEISNNANTSGNDNFKQMESPDDATNAIYEGTKGLKQSKVKPLSINNISSEVVEVCGDMSDTYDPIVVSPRESYISYSSVHYDDLVRPGIYFCKRCSQCFYNRYQVIIHETVHLSIEIIRDVTAKRPPAAPCVRCNKTVRNHDRHRTTCYGQRCKHCNKFYWITKKRKAHEEACTSRKDEYKKNLKICEPCRMSLESKKDGEYVCLGKLTDLSKTRRCHACKGQFQRLWVMGEVPKRTVATVDRIKFERSGRSKTKQLSNHERLKVIRQRLKMMNK